MTEVVIQITHRDNETHFRVTGNKLEDSTSDEIKLAEMMINDTKKTLEVIKDMIRQEEQ